MGLAGEEEKLKRVKAMAERVLGLPGEAALEVLDYLLFYLYLFVLSSFFLLFSSANFLSACGGENGRVGWFCANYRGRPFVIVFFETASFFHAPSWNTKI